MGQDVLVITGGTIAAEYGTFKADLIIRDGRIAGIVDDARDISGERLDASGLVVFPGGVDMHTHLREPSRIEREGFAHGTASAAAGGISTVVDMPQADPLVADVASFRQKRDAASRSAVVDFGLHAAAIGQSIDQMAALKAEGALAFKAFMCASSPGYPRLNDAALVHTLRAVRELDSTLIVHAENDDLLQDGLAQMAAAGRIDPLAHAESRPPIVEIEAVRRAIYLAGATGARLHIAHASTAATVRAVARARKAGHSITCETCPQYLVMDLGDLLRLGPFARCAPALRDRAEVEALWAVMAQGTVAAICSDHSPYTLAEKQAGNEDIFKAPLGLNVIQVMLPSIVDEGIHRRGLSYTWFANLSAAGPARLLGLYPQKGSIRVGADADLTLWDMEQQWEVRREDLLSRHPWTPLEGRRLQGRVIRTIVRGRSVFADGRILVEPGTGQFLRAASSPAIAPAVLPV
ncbi:MAG: dihydroorotase, multifunctional complex type [Chloroflexi bacterium]|jgi:allantoinase|nr:dihydroorotase, multifunctional complex type [Chloroflexota bacterium]